MNAMRFAELLTLAINIIKAKENKNIGVIQDEIGYVLGRDGGSAIDYWRRGHIPTSDKDVEILARELARRGGFDHQQTVQFLRSANYPDPKGKAKKFFPYADDDPVAEEASQFDLSPFVVGPPITKPSQFFGRERIVKKVFDRFKKRPFEHTAIIGLKRTGKTSLLYYLKNIHRAAPATLRPQQNRDWLPPTSQLQWVLVDFQDPRLIRREGLFRYILTELKLPVPQPCSFENFLDVMEGRLRKSAVIMMDELGAGLLAPELNQPFWWGLRSLVSHSMNGKLAFVVAAHDDPMKLADEQQKVSDFFNIFHTSKLEPFTIAEAHELIANSPIPFAAADSDWILQRFPLWPPILQVLCQLRLTYLEEGRTDAGWQEEAVAHITTHFQHLILT